MLLQRNWREVQRRRSWRAVAATAVACGALAASAALQWCCHTAWDAPGAGPRQTPVAGLADVLQELSLYAAACCATWVPASDLALLGPLLPARATGLAAAGHKLAFGQAAQAELVQTAERLFAQRPPFRRALQAALLQDNRLHDLLDFSA